VPAANGTKEFSLLQNELKGTSTKIILVAFDLLYLNRCDLRKLPLIEHKAQLKKIIDETNVQFGDSSRSKAPRCTRESFEFRLSGSASCTMQQPGRPIAPSLVPSRP
jgi:bifunctional non-homologous end joining protein LigD